MAKKVSNKTIQDYLEKIGAADPTNSFLLDEFEYNESLGKLLKDEIKKEGIITSKGRLSQAFIGYKMFLRNKIDLSTKLVMTVQDRKKIKTTEADATQLEFENFHAESAN